jgi:hypothetical protein
MYQFIYLLQAIEMLSKQCVLLVRVRLLNFMFHVWFYIWFPAAAVFMRTLIYPGITRAVVILS